jgi:hypothetical protein
MPHYNRHKIALEIQDACNLRALAREFVKIVDAADAESTGTEATWADAAVRLFVSKFESLCYSSDNFSKAYDECVAKAEKTNA